MEITVIHSSCSCSCSTLHSYFRPQVLHFCRGGASKSAATSLSFQSDDHFRRFRKTLPSTEAPLISRYPLRRFPSTSCSLSDNQVPATEVIVVDQSHTLKKKVTEISPELKGTSIFLVGMSSTMKNNVGKFLADALRYYYFDSDSLVEQVARGEYATNSLKARDAKGFCESETEVLKQLSSMGRLVVCVGDGAVSSSVNLALLRHGISIWIDVPLDIIAREATAAVACSTSDSSEVLAIITKHYEDWRNGYATSDATVSLQKVACQLGYDNTDAVSTEDMTIETLKEIEKLMRVKKMMEAAARPF
ncbi:probable inactive shikimate kinase like 1, chloroplastic isoform X2 [Macadamia integrifolia]|uniref:probable inactive shikimate kinase like 1, chloroplastic isoform X2 n=1 Tax=Macadamia integrifolia TaxID=60698 RepID=UPI001C4E6604|nr:probable inactive shikimate kinase like 1, chloroplastic isoform X2 [Macadamia integrifolia]